METSPWVRTLQTASQVAQVIGVDTINVNYLMSENPFYLKTWDKPLPEAFDQLDINVNTDLSEKALNGLLFNNDTENLDAMKERWNSG